jgi:hypothetical protein
MSDETELDRAWRELREAFIRTYRLDRLVLWLSRRRIFRAGDTTGGDE